MLSGLYSAATAMDSATARHEVIARNLAHANVPGFRRSFVVSPTFETALASAGQTRGLREAWGVGAPQVMTDFSLGSLQQTGRTLDLALGGEGFFVVAGPAGPLYTRNGAFQLDGEGRLITSDGLTVQGEGGPISIPPEIPVSEVSVGRDGTVSARQNDIGRLRVVKFADPQQLRSAGASLFDAGQNEAQPSDAEVVQGVRELSNVSTVEELIRMIVGLRHYEAAQKALRTIDDAVRQNTSPQRG